MQSSQTYSACTALHDLRLYVHLGVTEEERAKPQLISVDVRCYSSDPLSSYSDDEGEYICYGKLSDRIKNFCYAKPYRLIEFMGARCFEEIRESISEQLGADKAKDVAVWIRIHKLKPPVEDLKGGSSFTTTDLPETVYVP